MSGILQIAAVALIGTLCALTLRKQVAELGLVLAILTGVLLLTSAFSSLRAVKDFFFTLTEMAGLQPELLSPLIKTVGIAILTRVTADLCRDAGEGGIASFAETAGGAAAICVALPLAQAVLNMISGLL